VKVPTVGESINEVTLSKWIKKDGDYVQRDEVICELESDKATFELNAEQAGVLKTNAKEGDTLKIGDTVATIDTNAQAPAGGTSNTSSNTAPANTEAKTPVAENAAPQDQPGEGDALPKEKLESGPQPNVTIASSMPTQPAQQGNAQSSQLQPPQNQAAPQTNYATGTPSPAAAKLMAEQNVGSVNGSGRAGRSSGSRTTSTRSTTWRSSGG